MHEHTNREKADARLARIEGHVKSVRRMLNEKECDEILIQLAAIQSALKQVSLLILDDHMIHCIDSEADEAQRESTIENLRKAIKYLVENR